RSGEPLIGATVLLKGSSIGTITDLEGRYTLKIPPAPAMLVVNYTGYTSQEIPVNSAAQQIVLQEGAVLDEIVVTGLRRDMAPVFGRAKEKRSRADAS
ncbi:MAG: carboxypeptidase-like regulatory domain-containing protein, partial [Saprospiraceae bacterium]|nr:carboxypeptidase-like regulatory domain-containing protein [Saprospiraceae bacterium]